MKRLAALAAVIFIFAAVLTGRVSAESSATSIDLYCTVNSDGDCLVSMTVDLNLEAADSGLTFPLPYGAREITMNGSSVATYRVGDQTLVEVGKITGGMTGAFEIRFDYTIPGAVGVTSDSKLQLTLPMLCGFDYPVESLSFIITLPDDITETPVFTSTYQQTGFDSNLSLIINGNMMTGSSVNTLNDHESVTMTLSVPQDMFPTVSVYQRTGNPELYPMGAFAVLALLYWLIWLRTLPPPRFRTAVPPEGISAGELASRVTMTGCDLTLTVLSWAQMGYVMIQPKHGQVLLRKQMDMGNERNLFEIRLFQTLFKKKNVINCSGRTYASLRRKAAAFVPGEKGMCRPKSGSRKVYRVLLCVSHAFCGLCVAMNMTSITVLQILFGVIFAVAAGYSAWYIQEFAMCGLSRGKKTRRRIALALCVLWTLLGLIGSQPWIPLGSCAVQLLLGYLAAYGGRRTELNRSEAGEILSLRRYLRGIPRPEAARLLKTDSEYFFRMAPYAIALGVGKPFANAFGRRPLEPCPYILTSASNHRTAAEWMRILTQVTEDMDERYHRAQLERWMIIRFR